MVQWFNCLHFIVGDTKFSGLLGSNAFYFLRNRICWFFSIPLTNMMLCFFHFWTSEKLFGNIASSLHFIFLANHPVDGEIRQSPFDVVDIPVFLRALTPCQVVFSPDFWSINKISAIEKTLGTTSDNISYPGTPKPWKMKVLHPKIWVITPKNEGFGFLWESVLHRDSPQPLTRLWESWRGRSKIYHWKSGKPDLHSQIRGKLGPFY